VLILAHVSLAGIYQEVTMLYDNKQKEIDQLIKQIDKFRPFKKEMLDQIKEYNRIGLTYSSNALEGNSLTETETKIVLEDGLTIGGKPLKDHYEAMGHSEAYTQLYNFVKTQKITEKDILELHRLFYYRIDTKNAGVYRKVKVIITGTEFIPPFPSEVPKLMKKLVLNIPKMKKKYHPVELAALIHKEFVTIHPFIDGNGRAARLLMNLVLLQAGYVITIIPPILRYDYISTLRQSQTSEKNSTQFVNFITNMVYESMKDYIRLLKAL
jgi:Fic family protein